MKLFLALFVAIGVLMASSSSVSAVGSTWWPIQSIDTMKYSRDLASQTLDSPASFQSTIDFQVKAIAQTGATHVSIATPYDEKFIPVLKMWVKAARANHIHVWFRGNFSGWEGWFGYDRIGRDAHAAQLQTFLDAHAELFETGDVFSSCPECENGGPGDPRMTGDIAGHREFLIKEYAIAKDAFFRMGKNVTPNLMSMNGDVARVIMDEQTTKSLGGYVVIDHYVATPEKMIEDIQQIAQASKGKIVIGEFGAPVPDIHGDMTEKEQQQWVDRTFAALAMEKSVVGVNYWVGFGGSTELWNIGGSPRLVVDTVHRYFAPPAASGFVHSRDNSVLANVTVKTPWRTTTTAADGSFMLPLSANDTEISVFAKGYHAQNITVSTLGTSDMDIRLEKEQYSLFEQFKLWLLRIFG